MVTTGAMAWCSFPSVAVKTGSCRRLRWRRRPWGARPEGVSDGTTCPAEEPDGRRAEERVYGASTGPASRLDLGSGAVRPARRSAGHRRPRRQRGRDRTRQPPAPGPGSPSSPSNARRRPGRRRPPPRQPLWHVGPGRRWPGAISRVVAGILARSPWVSRRDGCRDQALHVGLRIGGGSAGDRRDRRWRRGEVNRTDSGIGVDRMLVEDVGRLRELARSAGQTVVEVLERTRAADGVEHAGRRATRRRPAPRWPAAPPGGVSRSSPGSRPTAGRVRSVARSDDAQPGDHAALGVGEHVDGHAGLGRRRPGRAGRRAGRRRPRATAGCRSTRTRGRGCRRDPGRGRAGRCGVARPPVVAAAGWIGPAPGPRGRRSARRRPGRSRAWPCRSPTPSCRRRSLECRSPLDQHDDAMRRSVGHRRAVDDGVQSCCCSYQRRIASTAPADVHEDGSPR